MKEVIEEYKNCTVLVERDTRTGDISISWYDNTHPPVLIFDNGNSGGEEND